MKTQQINSWGFSSTSFWLTGLVAIGIIFIGSRFIIMPNVGAEGFGIPLLSSKQATAYGWIKGIRDIYSGVTLLIFLILRKRRATAFVFAAAIIIPVSDFFTILSVNGSKDVQHLLIHVLTAVYMILTTILLFKAPKN